MTPPFETRTDHPPTYLSDRTKRKVGTQEPEVCPFPSESLQYTNRSSVSSTLRIGPSGPVSEGPHRVRSSLVPEALDFSSGE